MLSDPNVKKIMPKAGNRYEAALALSKRAREIEERRFEKGQRDIHDAVDLAAIEIIEGKTRVKINGKYVVNEEETEKKEENQNEGQ